MKISKRAIKIGGGICIGLLCIIGTILLNRGRTNHIDIPIAVSTQSESPRIGYGSLFDQGRNILARGSRTSILLEEGCEAEISMLPDYIEEVQLIYKGDETILLNWIEIAETLKDKKVYVSLAPTEVFDKKEVQADYTYLQHQLSSASGIDVQVIYDYRLLSTLKDVEYVGINITHEEDIEELLRLQTQVEEPTKIIVNDWIVNYNKEDLTQSLDLINQLYYDSAIYAPSVEVIYQNSSLESVHERIPQEYSKILNNSWITTHEELVQETLYITEPQEMYAAKDKLELLVPYNEEIEYVEYKVNGETAGQVYRYPYMFTYDSKDMYNGVNQVRVIVKFKEEDKIEAENIYFNVDNKKEVAERAPRTTPNYPKKDQMIYDYPYIPVLMYHDFKDSVGEDDDEQSITVGTGLFEEQIVAMLEAGYTPITFFDLENYFKGTGGLPDKPIIITTDDGYLSNYTIAYPILQKYNVPATYFITSMYIGVETTKSHFTWDQALEMEESGLIDIQSHTHAHGLLDKMGKSEVLYQVGVSFEIIEEHLGKRDIKILSYPQFHHNKHTVEWIQGTDIDMQITNLAKHKSETTPLDVKRIHVSNLTEANQLIEEIERLTME